MGKIRNPLIVVGGGETQEKTATVIDELQEVVPDSGYTLSKVTVPPTRAKTRLAELVDRSIEFIANSELEGITSIEGYTFYGCSDLIYITIPDSVTSIGTYTFYRCSSLTSITIPDSVTSIGTYTFDGCSGLTSITIPDSVASIGSGAFQSCSSLTEITCLAITPPTLGGVAFSGSGITASAGTIRVPSANLNAYKTATNWSTYANIMVGI